MTTIRKPRLFWANYYCLLDTSSGASINVRQMLLQLQEAGFEILVLGATIFDAENGQTHLLPHAQALQAQQGALVDIQDGPLTHKLLITEHWQRAQMRHAEIDTWHGVYRTLLKDWQPDLVWFYGGSTPDLLIPYEARRLGISSVAYLANGNYKGTRWCTDVDQIVTDSQATAKMYRERLGIDCIPVGLFINPRLYLANQHQSKHLLFVNPSLVKGAAIVVQLAILLEKCRPEITLEVVESRGSWQEVVEMVTTAYGNPRSHLDNVILTPTTADMRPVYSRARVLLAPSLWWESAGRVVVEALLNGIPSIVTNRGGLPEMGGIAAVKVDFPAECYQPPYTKLPTMETLEPLLAVLIRFWDDEAFYQEYVQKALQMAKETHSLAANTQRLLDALLPLVKTPNRIPLAEN